MSAYDDYKDYMLDVEDVKRAYQTAFKDIVFPENYGSYSAGAPIIENRRPGTPISASVWNSTVNDLRNICGAVARSMAAYNTGVGKAFDIFVEKINKLLQHLLDIEYQDLVEWLLRAQFQASFINEPTGAQFPTSSKLQFTISDGTEAGTINVQSPNLILPQVIWDVANQAEPPEGWRIKIDSRAEIQADTLVSGAQLYDTAQELIEYVAENYVLKTTLTDTIGDLSGASVKSYVDGSIAALPIANIQTAMSDLQTELGERPSGEERTLWQVLSNIIDNRLTNDEVAQLKTLAQNSGALLNLGTRVTQLETKTTELTITTNAIVDAYNPTVRQLKNSCVINSLINKSREANTENSTTGYKLVVGGTEEKPEYSIGTYQIPIVSWDITECSTGGYVNYKVRADSSGVYFNAQGGYGWIHGTIRTGGSAKVIGRQSGNHYCWPLLTIPEEFIPATLSFDNILTAVTSNGNIVEMQILTKQEQDGDKYYRADKTTDTVWAPVTGRHVLAITNYRAAGQNTPSVLPSGVTILFNGAYRLYNSFRYYDGNQIMNLDDSLLNAPGVTYVTIED